MWRPRILSRLGRLLFHEDLFLFWPGLFFVSLGLLLRWRGVEHFPMPGGRGSSGPVTAEPAMLFWIGAPFIGLGLLRIVLVRVERAKERQKALRQAANGHRVVKRKSKYQR